MNPAEFRAEPGLFLIALDHRQGFAYLLLETEDRRAQRRALSFEFDHPRNIRTVFGPSGENTARIACLTSSGSCVNSRGLGVCAHLGTGSIYGQPRLDGLPSAMDAWLEQHPEIAARSHMCTVPFGRLWYNRLPYLLDTIQTWADTIATTAAQGLTGS